jgi:hypothetical protein
MTAQLGALPTEVDQLVHDWMVRTVAAPAADLGRPGPVCPYLLPALTRDLVVRRGRSWNPDEPDPIGAVADLIRDAMALFRSTPWPTDNDHLRSVVVVATGMPREQWPLIETVHAALKTTAVTRGLMIGQFHPDCATGSVHNPAFAVLRSPYPLIVVRSMARHDLFFLHDNPTWFRAWARRFGRRQDTGEGGGNVRLAQLYYEASQHWGEQDDGDCDKSAAEEVLV